MNITGSSTQLLYTKINLLVGASSHEDLRRVIGFRELDPGNGDGGGAGVPEDGFTGFEVGDEIEGLRCSDPSLGKVRLFRIRLCVFPLRDASASKIVGCDTDQV